MSMLEIVPTEDGSFTLYNSVLNTHYHSLHGAVGESKYIYLQSSGLESLLSSKQCIQILEIGLGTGLNFFLTLGLAKKYPNNIIGYHSYEPFPPDIEILESYYQKTQANPNLDLGISWAEIEALLPSISKANKKSSIWNLQYQFFNKPWEAKPSEVVYDIIYMDAFGPFTAPDLWTEEIILSLYNHLLPNGNIVTFSVSGETRRILRKHNISHERPKGYGKKREMLIIKK